MINGKRYIGSGEIKTISESIKGDFVEIAGEKFYRINNYHLMKDFFISIVSDTDQWMFISSNGALTAGRKNRDNALFPYYTVDKIHDQKNITGSKSIFIIKKEKKKYIWEPFTADASRFYQIERNLYKNISGNKIVFEEINSDLQLAFRYGWYNSEQYGFVKKSTLSNLSQQSITIEVLDGIQNIMPYGVGFAFQNEYSNLLDAYKKNERPEGSSLGIFTLSAIPVDRAEPSECLKATTVWSFGLKKEKILLSNLQLDDFIQGKEIQAESDIRAERGAYYINAQIKLSPKSEKEWYFVAEINQGTTAIANLLHQLNHEKNFNHLIEKDIDRGTNKLNQLVSSADGLQKTTTEICIARHYTNTLFNIMRGGIFINNYTICTEDFKKYLWEINKLLSKEFQEWLHLLPEFIEYFQLIRDVSHTKNADLLRITYEYLPLTFSRRHGDPSRPWNLFSIETKKENGDVKYYYAGNWRDIFQNWEALSYSFPGYIEGFISKFVNASTIDGYNPYRIMRDGIDWESPDPRDPWAYIGYWGDHQIIYLQKLLELSHQFHPGKLDELLENEIFTYANVPYRIKSFEEILKDPKNTVVFDRDKDQKIRTEKALLGADANLVKDQSGESVYKVNLSEKILVTLLSKLSNFIPEAGIWLNTQRPEWNDANNALVGNGVSMVTLYYLRRFLTFWINRFESLKRKKINISEEVADLFYNIQDVFETNSSLIKIGFSNEDRKQFTEKLGKIHSSYRNEIYNYLFSGEKVNVPVQDIFTFLKLALKYIDQSIKVNKREDGLYHSYNLISFEGNAIKIRHLYEMLEGQVAILSSGYLNTRESVQVLNALKVSKMFREDQYSYMLYPDRNLKRFLDKNTIPTEWVGKSKLLTKLIDQQEESIISKDMNGAFHFNGNFRNASDLENALNELRTGAYSHLVEKEKTHVLDIYEKVFDHQSFTGRSGTFFGYEGLGSIYWHMVSKLLLATQECFFNSSDEASNAKLKGQLKAHYYEIKAGIGLYKEPSLYGAFPTDAYSHTPLNKGVKQPGLTGQVKEDVISRIGEMGIIIKNGQIHFEPSLFNDSEIPDGRHSFEYFDIYGSKQSLQLTKNQIAFTFCQVPVIYTFSETEIGTKIKILLQNNLEESILEMKLNNSMSNSIFERNGQIQLVNVFINRIIK